jgi:hypothetical protein
MSNRFKTSVFFHWCVVVSVALSGANGEDEDAPWRGPQPVEGKPWPTEAHFFQRYWFQMGQEFSNPITNDRFRVNDPYVATHPEFHARKEPKGNGLMLVPFNEVIREIDAARLYVELWGGHPYTDNRRVTVNGRTTYPIPAPVEDQCTHIYRYIPLKITDLVNGNNALQFNVDGDKTFWGHFIVEEAALDALLPSSDDRLKPLASLVDDPSGIRIDTSKQELVKISLPIDGNLTDKVACVHYYAKYDGYDENGDGVNLDWHEMTKRKVPVGHIGTSSVAPYAIEWDTSMIKAQNGVQVRAVVEFLGDDKDVAAETSLREQGKRYWKARTLCMQTAPSDPFAVTHPEGIEVAIIACENWSVPFWSRTNKKKRCEFPVSIPTDSIERAQLSIAVWDGGAGTVEDYFQLNQHALKVAGSGKHDAILSKTDLDTNWIVPGKNEAVLVSDTVEHGIEVLHPGPALTIRYQVSGGTKK